MSSFSPGTIGEQLRLVFRWVTRYSSGIMRSRTGRFIAIFLLHLLFASTAIYAAPSAQSTSRATPTHAQLLQEVNEAVAKLQSWYNPKTGLWRTTGWWNSANALTALIDYSRVAHTSRYATVLTRTYAANIHTGFINEYYDDEGWWALAWVDAYDLTGQHKYLQTAQRIFADMTGGWDNTCGRGIWWSKKRRYKNAIANELFLSVAAHLSNRAPTPKGRSEYASWANRESKWFRDSSMIEPDHLISDGLTSTCKDNRKTKWTYNQGVVLGGLVELARHDRDRAPLRLARQIADAAIQHLAGPDGILHEPCEPACGADGSQFKGIFMRNLTLLDRDAPTERYRQFILSNADSILRDDQAPDHALGLIWSGPPGKPNASTQSSAIDALVAALEIETSSP
jgi:predicted alpha-1,6-mannanase (GH76 family)